MRPGSRTLTSTAWERFVAGEEVHEGVRPDILLSWYRCRDDYRVDHLQERAPSAADDEPAHSLEDDVVAAELGGVAKSIEPDAAAIGGLVAVTDGQGRILASWGAPEALDLAQERNLGPWCTWSEATTGTNGMGTALKSDEPVFVRGWEHWCAGFHHWDCAGVAVRDPVTRQPLGVLDVSSSGRPLPDTVLAWLRRAGMKVEAGLRDRALRSFGDLLAVFREHERTPGVLAAADKSGRLVLANEEAQRLFATGSPDPPLELRLEHPELKEVVVKAAEHARHDRRWTGLAQLYLPAVGDHVTIALRPAIKEDRLVGVLLTTDSASLHGELVTANPAVSSPAESRVVGYAGNRMVLLAGSEIRFAAADGNDVWLDTARGRLRASGRGLSALEDRLRGQGFLRVHRQFLVNLRWVKEIAPSFQGSFCLVLDGPGTQLVPVSRRRVPEVRQALGVTWKWSAGPPRSP